MAVERRDAVTALVYDARQGEEGARRFVNASKEIIAIEKAVGVASQEAAKIRDAAAAKSEKIVGQYSSAFQRLERSLEPAVAQAERQARALHTLDVALQKGNIDLQEHARLVDLTRQKYDSSYASLRRFADEASRARQLERASQSQTQFNQVLGVREISTGSAARSADAFAPLIARQEAEELGRVARQAAVAQAAYNSLLGVKERTTGAAQASAAAFMASAAAQGTSAAATRLNAFQMQNLSYQLNDVFVSLASGQAPLTVLIQQGSQIAPIFGGIGQMARLLLNPVTAVIAALVALGAAGAAAATHAETTERSFRVLETGLAATSRAGALTRADLAGLVDQAAALPGVSREAGQSIVAEFTRARGVSAELFSDMTRGVADFAARTGKDAPAAAKELAQALADPERGAKALSDAYGLLSAAQVRQVEQLAGAGDKLAAQRILLDAVNSSSRDLALDGLTTLGRTLDSLSKGWDNLKRSMLGATGAASMSAGGIQTRIDEIDILLNREGGPAGAANAGLLRAERNRLQQQLEAARTAETQAAYGRIGQDYAGTGMSAQDVLKAGASVGSKYDPTSRLDAMAGDAQRLALAYSAATDMGDAAGAAAAQRQLAELTEQYQKALVTDEDRARAAKAIADQRERERDLAKAVAAEEKEIAAEVKRRAVAVEELQRSVEAEQKLIAAFPAYIRDLQQQTYLVGLTRDARADEEAVLRASAKLQRELTDGEKERVVTADRQLRSTRQASETAERAAQESVRFWDRAADNIGDSLAEALVAGFDRGKSGAELFVDSLKRMLISGLAEVFSAQFFRPAISSVFAAVGLGSGAQASSGGGGILDLFGGVASAANPNGLGGILTSAGTGISSFLGLGGGAAAAESIALAGSLGAPVGASAGALAGGGAGALGGIGAAVPYVGAALALGTLAYSLFGGKKPSVGPNGTAGVLLEGGQLVGRMTSGDNGFGGGQVVSFANSAADALNQLAQQLKTSVTPAAIGGFAELQGRLGFSGDGGGYATGTSADTAVADYVRDAISRGALAGISQVDDALIAGAITGKLDQALADQMRGPLLSAVNEQIQAQQQLADAYSRTAESIQQTIDQLKVSDISPLTPAQRLAEARGQFAAVVGRAREGDLDALGQAGQLAQQVLQLSRAYSPAGYGSDFSATLSTLGDLRDVSTRFATQANSRQEELLGLSLEVDTASLGRLQAIEDEMKGLRSELQAILAVGRR